MSSNPSLTCRQMADFLMDYLNDELESSVRARFEVHLHRCPNCVRYLETYTLTTRLCRSAFHVDDAEVPREIPEDLVAAILDALRRET
ncbi:MAG TPA: zf-HC2 domain-containing protein [Vicinamibacterales bacterium]